MNILENMSDILGGTKNPRSVECAFNTFFDAARSIRSKLGEKRYLADRYIEALLTSLTVVYIPQVTDDGFDSVGPLLGQCVEVVDGKHNGTPLAECATRYLRNHLMTHKDRRTRLALLECVMFPAFCDAAYASYAGQLVHTVETDQDHLTTRGHYDDIKALLGGEVELEALNSAFKDAFLSVAHMQAFLQGAINSIIDVLIDRDKETAKPIFALLFDLPPSPSDR